MGILDRYDDTENPAPVGVYVSVTAVHSGAHIVMSCDGLRDVVEQAVRQAGQQKMFVRVEIEAIHDGSMVRIY